MTPDAAGGDALTRRIAEIERRCADTDAELARLRDALAEVEALVEALAAGAL